MTPEDLALAAASRLFRDVDPAELEKALGDAGIAELLPGQVLLAPGAVNDRLYLVLTGRLRVYLEELGEPPYVPLEPGDTAGELSIIDRQRVSAFVAADLRTRLLVIGEAGLWTLIERFHGVARNLLHILSARMRHDNETIREAVRLQREFERAATVDSLTGLHNRRWMDEVFARQVRRSAENGDPLTLLMVDVDHFKRFNDDFGHQAGDRVLCNVARVLLALSRPGDLLARYGGEEFVLLLPGADAAGAAIAAERLRSGVEQSGPLPFEGQSLPPVTVSIGLARMRPGDTLSSLIDAADQALYRAKDRGRNCISD